MVIKEVAETTVALTINASLQSGSRGKISMTNLAGDELLCLEVDFSTEQLAAIRATARKVVGSPATLMLSSGRVFGVADNETLLCELLDVFPK